MSSYYEVLQNGSKNLKQQGIADANVDAWYLLDHLLGINRAEFYLHKDEPMPEEYISKYNGLITMRSKRVPLQYITGTQEFMGLSFTVNENVLIPRQDTECLVEEVLKVCKGKRVLDLCTGSGCIIISLAKLGEVLKATGSDICPKALEVARVNAECLEADVEFIQSNLFSNIEGVYDIIVSNPPYIPTEVIKDLMPEVKDNEPIKALDGSMDGLIFYRQIARELGNYLTKDGQVFFEIGHDQGPAVMELLRKEGFNNINIKKDLSGLDRIVAASY